MGPANTNPRRRSSISSVRARRVSETSSADTSSTPAASSPDRPHPTPANAVRKSSNVTTPATDWTVAVTETWPSPEAPPSDERAADMTPGIVARAPWTVDSHPAEGLPTISIVRVSTGAEYPAIFTARTMAAMSIPLSAVSTVAFSVARLTEA